MTTDELARDYFRRVHVRRRVLALLFEAGEYADVVREAQELVELALKGMLRWAGIDPPRWHDVGAILAAERERLPASLQPSLEELIKGSAWLRKEREMAFYGEIDFVPGQHYDRELAVAAIATADATLAAIGHLDEPSGSSAPPFGRKSIK